MTECDIFSLTSYRDYGDHLSFKHHLLYLPGTVVTRFCATIIVSYRCIFKYRVRPVNKKCFISKKLFQTPITYLLCSTYESKNISYILFHFIIVHSSFKPNFVALCIFHLIKKRTINDQGMDGIRKPL